MYSSGSLLEDGFARKESNYRIVNISTGIMLRASIGTKGRNIENNLRRRQLQRD
jgi:hypothetical protein